MNSPAVTHRRQAGARRALSLLIHAVLSLSASAAVYHVDANKGSDDNSGSSISEPLASIQKAAEKCEPGDRIVVARGVYYGPIELNIKGTAEHPITIEAADRARYAVVITNAERAIREKRSTWEPAADIPGAFSTPLAGGTARVLYSGTDLQPYLSLEGLKTFTTAEGLPGPAHGYFYDESAKRLYVRLHASGKYGSPNPADHVISAGPRTGNGSAGTVPNGPDFYNLGLMERGDTHVIVDGFTFETPGCAGVFVNGHHVTVRNSWFLGCRVGVSGRRESSNPADTSNNVTVEHCDYTQYPAFDDMLEVMNERRPPEGAPRYPLYWWSRKGGGTGNKLTYELGICGLVGSDWTLSHSRVHDAFEGISTWCLRWSKGFSIHDNSFERLVDNAIELEDHTADMRIFRNYILDTVEPLSWQPLGGTPWPGPAYIYENVIVSDAGLNRAVFERGGHVPGWFKAGATQDNWTAPWNRERMQGVSMDAVRAPGDGIVVFNNTVIYPGGRFLTLVQPSTRRFENFHFINNLVVTQTFGGPAGYRASDMAFRNNLWITSPGPDDGTGGAFAGQNGSVVAAPANLPTSPRAFLDAPDIPAADRGVPVPEADGLPDRPQEIAHIGAILRGHEWTPPIVGPQVSN